MEETDPSIISIKECRQKVVVKLGLDAAALDARKDEFKSLATEALESWQSDSVQQAPSPLDALLSEQEPHDVLQMVYLVTISRVRGATLPDGREYKNLDTTSRQDIATAVADAFNNPLPTGSSGGRPRVAATPMVSTLVVFREHHHDQSVHFHVAVKLARSIGAGGSFHRHHYSRRGLSCLRGPGKSLLRLLLVSAFSPPKVVPVRDREAHLA